MLGDATYDFKDHLRTGVRNQVPPFMVRTSYWWTASDPTYVSVNGEDEIPDLAIGRLPARTAAEARVLVEKIVAYETGGTRAGILDAFDRGTSLMSYLGHGSISIWASENVFNVRDVGSLSPQAQQPFLLTMNCLSGYFHFPYLNSLSEEVVKADGRGALAAFSPSGLSLSGPAHRYHKALLSELLSGKRERLGDAVLAAQAAYAESGEFLELISIYHLLGDPALRVR